MLSRRQETFWAVAARALGGGPCDPRLRPSVDLLAGLDGVRIGSVIGAKELFALAMRESVPIHAPRTVGGRSPSIEVDADQATVVWREADIRMLLQLENGHWKVEAVGPASRGAPVRVALAAGEEFVLMIETDLRLATDGPAVRPSDVPGAVAFTRSGKPHDFRLTVTADGSVVDGSENPVTGESRRAVLRRVADLSRDALDSRYLDTGKEVFASAVTLYLAVDPDCRWGALQHLLRECLEPSVSFREFVLITEETGYLCGKGVQCGIGVSYRHDLSGETPVPAARIRVGTASAELVTALYDDLRSVLLKMDSGIVAVDLHPDLPYESGLRALAAIAAAGGRWIRLAQGEGEVRELEDGIAIGDRMLAPRPARAIAAPEEGIRLSLEQE
jgi:hypothetical protein